MSHKSCGVKGIWNRKAHVCEWLPVDESRPIWQILLPSHFLGSQPAPQKLVLKNGSLRRIPQ